MWMILIFYLSSMHGGSSEGTSNGLTRILVKDIINIFKLDISEYDLFMILNVPIRKFAHVFEYFILSILLYNSFELKNKFLLVMLFSIIYACIDEIHQMFVIGRNGCIYDVFIDSLGILFGYLVCKCRYKGIV